MVRSQIKSQRQPQPSVGPATGLDGTTRQAPPYDAKKVDAWAMGVLLYLLVTGTYPFEVGLLEALQIGWRLHIGVKCL